MSPSGGASAAPRSGGRTRVVRRLPGPAGSACAVAGYCLSLTPSLLPRPWWLQALAAAVTAMACYAVGAVVGRLVRLFWHPRRRTVRVAGLAVAVLGAAAVVAVTARSVHWQGDLRRAVGMDPGIVWWEWLLVPPATLLLVAVMLLVGRALRLGTRTAARPLGRVLPRPAALGIAVAVVAVLVVGFVQGFLVRGVVDALEEGAAAANDATAPGVARPSSPTLSGSPASLESWGDLGAKGRDFVSEATTRGQLAEFGVRDAKSPVRVYVGLRSAPTLRARARMAVAELERTGAFRRKVLAVVATTGSGWVNERVAKPVEYLTGGDSALVAIQYSYLPSWLSFLTESEASEAGQVLFDAVRAEWESLPAGDRPKLVVGGESLGSYATEQAFGGKLSRMAGESDGAVLVGPTPDNPIRRAVTAGRNSGSPEWLPVYGDGRTVRFARRPADLDRPAGPWRTPRIVYLQNPTDPVTWWVPELAVEQPGWLDAPRGPDVSAAVQWYPLLTFWQVTCDLAGADAVPDGHGHRFGPLPADAWVKVLQPAGWTAGDTRRLDAVLSDDG